jgi:DNA repair protein RadC
MKISDSIKSWPTEDRPRQKLINNGPHALTDSELIAILLGKGTKNKSALTLSKELLQIYDNNLDLIGKKSLTDLKKIKGVGDAKAGIIAAALELGRRRQCSEIAITKLISSRDIFNFIGPHLFDLDHEEFWAILMHKNHRVIDKRLISKGGYDAVLVDVRMILKYAMEYNAVAMAVVHNHPSGNEKPSKSDTELTLKLKDACDLCSIALIDHVVIGSRVNYFSYFDNDLI